MIDRRIKRSMIFAVGASDIGFLLLLLILIKLNISSERFGVDLQLPAAPPPGSTGRKVVNPNKILVTEQRCLYYFTKTTKDSLNLASTKGNNQIVREKPKNISIRLLTHLKVPVLMYMSIRIPHSVT